MIEVSNFAKRHTDKSGNHADPWTPRPLKFAAVQSNGSDLYILPNNTTLRALYKHMGSKERCRDRSFKRTPNAQISGTVEPHFTLILVQALHILNAFKSSFMDKYK